VDWAAVGVTLRLAAATTAVLAVAGIPFAYWLATTPWRGRAAVEAVVALPIVLPPTVLGFFLLAASAGSGLPFTFGGLLVGSVLANVPFAVRPFAAAFAAVERRYLEASWCLGVSRWRTFLRVAVPLAWPGLLAGLVLTFAHTVGEFGVVLMIGGNVPGVTRTLSVAIYDDVQSLDYAAAAWTSAVLVAFALVALGVTQALAGRRRA
jgi:molybdate transport system permease protein